MKYIIGFLVTACMIFTVLTISRDLFHHAPGENITGWMAYGDEVSSNSRALRPESTASNAPAPGVHYSVTFIGVPLDNPLVLTVPTSQGRMMETFSTWQDMSNAEVRLGLR